MSQMKKFETSKTRNFEKQAISGSARVAYEDKKASAGVQNRGQFAIQRVKKSKIPNKNPAGK